MRNTVNSGQTLFPAFPVTEACDGGRSSHKTTVETQTLSRALTVFQTFMMGKAVRLYKRVHYGARPCVLIQH